MDNNQATVNEIFQAQHGAADQDLAGIAGSASGAADLADTDMAGPVGAANAGPVGAAAAGPVVEATLGPVGAAAAGPVGEVTLGPVGGAAAGLVCEAVLGPVGAVAADTAGEADLCPVGAAAAGSVGAVAAGPVDAAAALGPIGAAASGPVNEANLGPVGAAAGPGGAAAGGVGAAASSGPTGAAAAGSIRTSAAGPVGAAAAGPVCAAAAGSVGAAAAGSVGAAAAADSVGAAAGRAGATASFGPIGAAAAGSVRASAAGFIGAAAAGSVGAAAAGSVGAAAAGSVGAAAAGSVGAAAGRAGAADSFGPIGAAAAGSVRASAAGSVGAAAAWPAGGIVSGFIGGWTPSARAAALGATGYQPSFSLTIEGVPPCANMSVAARNRLNTEITKYYARQSSASSRRPQGSGLEENQASGGSSSTTTDRAAHPLGVRKDQDSRKVKPVEDQAGGGDRRPSFDTLIMTEMSILMEDIEKKLQITHGDLKKSDGPLAVRCYDELDNAMVILGLSNGTPKPEVLSGLSGEVAEDETNVYHLITLLCFYLCAMHKVRICLEMRLQSVKDDLAGVEFDLGLFNERIAALNSGSQQQQADETLPRLEALHAEMNDMTNETVESVDQLMEATDSLAAGRAVWIRMYRAALRKVAAMTTRNASQAGYDMEQDLKNHEELIACFKNQKIIEDLVNSTRTSLPVIQAQLNKLLQDLRKNADKIKDEKAKLKNGAQDLKPI